MFFDDNKICIIAFDDLYLYICQGKVGIKTVNCVKLTKEEFNKKVSNPRVKYAIKIDKSLFGIKDDTILKYYIGLILSTNLSVTSKLFERYKNNGIVISMSYGVNVIDDYVIISVSALCKDEQKFIENIEKDIKTLVIEKAEFERKKKSVLKSVIVDFDSIEEILDERVGIEEDRITFNKRKIETVIPKEFLKRDKRYLEEYIINAIMFYKKHNNKTILNDKNIG